MADTFRTVEGIFYLGDRAIPWAKSAPRGTSNGVHLMFENGYTLSIQWKLGNYCDGYPHITENLLTDYMNDEPRETTTAELGCWDHNHDWYRLGDGDDVIGWQTVEDVEGWIKVIADLPTAVG